MSDTFDFLGAVFGEYDGLVQFDLDGETVNSRDKDWIEENASSLYVYSTTPDDSVAFFWGAVDDYQPGDEDDAKLRPTTLLQNGATAIFVWALDTPSGLTRSVKMLGRLLDEDQFEPIPLPGTGDWKAVYSDAETFYTLDEIERAYGVRTKERKSLGDFHGARLLTEIPASVDLKRPMKASYGKNRESKAWKLKESGLDEFLGLMTQHREGDKDGLCVVMAELVGSSRTAMAVRAAWGIGLDIDSGMPGKELDELLVKFGALCVRHTTHSHLKSITTIKEIHLTRWLKKHDQFEGINEDSVQAYLLDKSSLLPEIVKKVKIIAHEHRDEGVVIDVQHAPIPKHRIIFPFETPFEIAKAADSQEAAIALWKKLPARLGDRIGGLPIDTAAIDPSRLFYLPRHAKGAAWESSVIGGDLLKWESLLKLDPMEELAEQVAVDEKSKGGFTKTEEGRKLIGWAKKYAAGFQIGDVIQEFAPDKVRMEAAEKLTVECPFDEYHSNAGDPDDVGFFCVNAAGGSNTNFVAHCQHASCQEHSSLDFLAKMIADEWFDEELLMDEEFNILDMGDEDDEEAAETEAEEEAPEEHPWTAAVSSLSKNSKEADVEDAFVVYVENGQSAVKEAQFFAAIKEQTGFGLQVSRRILKDAVRRVAAENNKEGVSTPDDPLKRLTFTYQGDYHFDEAAAICQKALKSANRKEQKPMYCCVVGNPVALSQRRSGAVVFEEMGARKMWAELNDLVTFIRMSEQGSASSRQPCPRDVADHVFERAESFLPEAPEILKTPFFMQDGTLILEPGWDGKDVFLVDTGLEVEDVPRRPSVEQVEEARDWLIDELMVDFPFLDRDEEGNESSAPSRANALAMLLTPFMRRIINAVTPVFLINKPIAGTGGTFLGALPQLLYDGVWPTPMHYSQNDEEMSKTLLAAALEARSHLFFDNITSFSSRILLIAITSRNIGGRLLGQTKTVEAPNRFGWIATGNNPHLSDEMERRTVRITLNAKTDDIQSRKFKHSSKFPEENRAKAIHCLLTLIQYWIAEGKPKWTDRTRASFERWAECVGGVLDCAGVDGFLANKPAAAADMMDAAIKEFVREWFHSKAGEVVTTSELFELATDRDLSILQGNSEDQKRGRFLRFLPSLEGRVFRLGDDTTVEVRSALNEDRVPCFTIQTFEDPST